MLYSARAERVQYTKRKLSFINERKGLYPMHKHNKGRKTHRSKYSTRRLLIALGAASAALIALLVLPSPDAAAPSGIQLVGAEPQADIYGPELPKNMVEGYTSPLVKSVLSQEEEVAGPEYYYALEGKKTYHMPTCRYAYASAKRMTLYEAYFLGYKPGNCCEAPSYQP